MARVSVIIGSVPKDGGTFTFYRNLRPALAAHGIDLRCVTVGKREAGLIEDAYVDDGCVVLAPKIRSTKRQAVIFSKWCERHDINIVIGLNSIAILSALPHLPEYIRRVARCANGFEHGYRITMSSARRLSGIVAITPQLHTELAETYGVASEDLSLIPNGIDPRPFDAAAQRVRGRSKLIRVTYLGRLEHGQKGVLHIPLIVEELNRLGTDFTLKIVGKGRDRTKLEHLLASDIAAGNVEFRNPVPPQAVPKILATTDCLLFPSHFEGCPNTLLEALMAGAVPVCWRLPGITDFIVDDGVTGHLCEVGDTAMAAQHIHALAMDRARLATMAQTAAKVARERFTAEIAATHYAALFRDVMKAPPPPWDPEPWRQFRVEANFRSSPLRRLQNANQRLTRWFNTTVQLHLERARS